MDELEMHQRFRMAIWVALEKVSNPKLDKPRERVEEKMDIGSEMKIRSGR